jgi:hypothetical protein
MEYVKPYFPVPIVRPVFVPTLLDPRPTLHMSGNNFGEIILATYYGEVIQVLCRHIWWQLIWLVVEYVHDNSYRERIVLGETV